MSDRFDHRLEHKLDTKPGGDGVVEVRRIELITGAGRRRRWTTADKARVVVESFVPGANVSEVARRNGLSPQQLFGWRREARALFSESGGDLIEAEPLPGAAGRAPSDARSSRGGAAKPGTLAHPANVDPSFAQVVVAPAAAPAPGLAAAASPPPSGPCPCATIEIIIGSTIVRVTGRIEAEALGRVLEAVRRAS